VIKPWIFEFFPAPHELEAQFDAKRSAAYFNAYLDLWTGAEPLGFEGIFFSEHHFGAAYSPSPNLLIAQMAARTRSLRLGVMGMVAPYHEPWQLVEEIGMLDHLTGGRLEIGTSAGIPNEMALVGLDMDEARARNDEAVAIIDAALREPVISHHGKFWNFDGLRLVPRPLQNPPPRWTTVVSIDSTRKAARRGSKICTGFHPNAKVKEIFDAYREEAVRAGQPAGPEQLALRRQVTLAGTDAQAAEALHGRKQAFAAFIAADPRVPAPGRQVLDTPSAHAFTVGEEEFIGGASASVAAEIVAQCRATGAGHFLAIFDRSYSPEALGDIYAQFGREVIPTLRRATVG